MKTNLDLKKCHLILKKALTKIEKRVTNTFKSGGENEKSSLRALKNYFDLKKQHQNLKKNLGLKN